MVKLLAIAFAGALLAMGAPASKTWESLGQLKSGDPIEVATRDHAAKGEFVSSSTESLTIRTQQGEQRFARLDVMRVVSRTAHHRMRNVLIGIGVGAGIGLAADQSLGTYLRNESNPDGARALIWTIPIAVCGALGAIPTYPTVYQK